MVYNSEITIEINNSQDFKPVFSAGVPASPFLWIAMRCEFSSSYSPTALQPYSSTGYVEHSLFRRVVWHAQFGLKHHGLRHIPSALCQYMLLEQNSISNVTWPLCVAIQLPLGFNE